jgi:hypothetical protein
MSLLRSSKFNFVLMSKNISPLRGFIIMFELRNVLVKGNAVTLTKEFVN